MIRRLPVYEGDTCRSCGADQCLTRFGASQNPYDTTTAMTLCPSCVLELAALAHPDPVDAPTPDQLDAQALRDQATVDHSD